MSKKIEKELKKLKKENKKLKEQFINLHKIDEADKYLDDSIEQELAREAFDNTDSSDIVDVSKLYLIYMFGTFVITAVFMIMAIMFSKTISIIMLLVGVALMIVITWLFFNDGIRSCHKTIRYGKYIVSNDWDIYTLDGTATIKGKEIEFTGDFILEVGEDNEKFWLTRKQFELLDCLDEDEVITINVEETPKYAEI